MSDPSQCALSSSVSKPEHQGSGRSKVTDFLITTKFPTGESLVRRTFEDFEWIQRRLVDECAGFIVPVLPNKKAANQKVKFSEDYVDERQQVLHRFLQRIINHRALLDAPALLPFFTANPNDWKAAKEKAGEKAADDVTSSHHGSDIDAADPNSIVIDAEVPPAEQKKKGKFGRWMEAKSDKWALRRKNLMMEETPAEAKKFQDLQEYADHLENCMIILSEDSKEYVSTFEAQSAKLQTMGAAFTQLWGEHELSNTSSSTMYQTLGDCWVSLCKRVQIQSPFGSRNLDTPLEELLLDVVALKKALSQRKGTVYKYTKSVQLTRKLQLKMDKLKMGDLSAQQDKYFQLERDLRAADLKEKELKELCQLISARLEQDVERFRVEWHERMREVMETYHQAQVRFLEEQVKLWKGALPTLSAIDDSRSDLPTRPKAVANPKMQIRLTTAGAKASFEQTAVSPTSPGSDIATSFESIEMGDSDAVAPAPAAAPPPPPTEAPPPPPTNDSGPIMTSV